MSIELLPVGVACQLACEYCYQGPLREAGNYSPGYDIAAMKRGLDAEGGKWSLFGGEPLLMKFDDVAELLRYGKAKFGSSSIQTNGALVTDAHLDLFDECCTNVGISIDGPDDLNDARSAGSIEKTRAATAATMRTIKALCDRNRAPSLIVTIHRGNAGTPEKVRRLVAWMFELDSLGIQHMRLHPLEIDHQSVRESLALTTEENLFAFRSLLHVQPHLPRLKFDLFVDMVKQLMTADGGSCVWHACDPLTTPAVRGVNGLGGRMNCSRTNKDGIDWVKADAHGSERYVALYRTPQEDGGCKGCRFFFACKGQCPGTAINGDWRNRSEQCELFFGLFEEMEADLIRVGKHPVSADAAKRTAIESVLLARWENGEPPTNREHGDHWDAPDGYEHSDGHWTVHGDQGTTESHGDHSDGSA